MRIRVSPQARADLDQIWFYFAREAGNENLATAVITAITAKFALLAKFPYIGRSLESATRPGIRSFPVENHLIFYSVRQTERRILRIIHVSRDAWAVFSHH